MVAQSFKFLRLNTCSNPRLSSFLSPKSWNGIAWRRAFNSQASSAGSEFEFDEVHKHSEFECDEVTNDAKVTEKNTALRSALSQLACDFGTESMLSLQRFFGARRAPVISTGSLKLDQALGIGGLPKGRIVEIYGREASGKTTLALHVIKEAQKLGGYCAYLDVENAMDPLLAEAIGVNTDNLLISQPDSAENLLSVVDTLTKSASVDVIVVDSVAALIPQLEIDRCISDSDSHRDAQSKIMTRALRKIHYSLCNSNTLIIFVNQVRSKVQSSKAFGRAEEVTCGGNALPFYAAVRLRMIRKELLKANDKITGLRVSVQVVKNKLAPAMANAELRIEFGRGICDEVEEALELACEHGVILQEGNGYFIEGEVLNSKEEAEAYLAENDGALDQVIKSLRAQLFRREGSS
ncbi:DNA repair protein recA homolog 2, mitochondrial [Ipomoea triloba]|uniref:DNA repair protein recA homolog 2, mitochondrial n=1 Tax=Ipomoea triloba TaxID=35885 RepID=UPI00125D772E|nr:DNA repair protein recA homolog 2, mitochondrial [Ipomoea triloba]